MTKLGPTALAASVGGPLALWGSAGGHHALGGERHGQEALRRWFERLGRVAPGLTLAIRDIWVKGGPWNTY